METTVSILDSVTGVFNEVGDWFVEVLPKITALFYNGESGLTIIGTLSIMGLGISVILLCLNMVKDFLRFR